MTGADESIRRRAKRRVDGVPTEFDGGSGWPGRHWSPYNVLVQRQPNGTGNSGLEERS